MALNIIAVGIICMAIIELFTLLGFNKARAERAKEIKQCDNLWKYNSDICSMVLKLQRQINQLDIELAMFKDGYAKPKETPK